jgi:hypothetical protein
MCSRRAAAEPLTGRHKEVRDKSDDTKHVRFMRPDKMYDGT